MGSRAELLRARLLDLLQARWTSTVVTVTAGAGFGKTTLLAQAFQENRIAPRGVDHWLSCSADDSGETVLGRHLSESIGAALPLGREPTVADLVDVIAACAPVHVSLLLDDAHLIERASTGADLLARVMAALPANGHLVLCGRSPLPRRGCTGWQPT